MKKYFYIFILFFIQATVLSCTDEEIYESPTDGKSSIKITLNVPVDNGKTLWINLWTRRGSSRW